MADELPRDPSADPMPEGAIARLGTHEQAICSIVFSPDGRMAATTGGDEVVRLWETDSGKQLHHWPTPDVTPWQLPVAFSPDGTTLAFHSQESIDLARCSDGEVFRTLKGSPPKEALPSRSSCMLRFSKDGTSLAAAFSVPRPGTQKRFLHWNTESGEVRYDNAVDLATLKLPELSGTTQYIGEALDLTPSLTRAIVGHASGRVHLVFDPESGKELFRLNTRVGFTTTCFSPDEKLIAVGLESGAIYLVDSQNGKPVRKISGAPGYGYPRAFLDDGHLLVSDHSDDTTRFWNVDTAEEVYRLKGHRIKACSADGRYAASATQTGEGLIWDLPRLIEVMKQDESVPADVVATTVPPTVDPPARDDVPIVFALDRSGLEADGPQDDAAPSRVATERGVGEIFCFEGHDGVAYSVAFSPDGSQILSGGKDMTLRLWDVKTGKEIRQFHGHTYAVGRVAFSPDGKRAISGSWDRKVRTWDVATGESLAVHSAHKWPALTVAYSPDGRRALSGSDGFYLWDLQANEVQRHFDGHTETVWTVTFGPDGKLALTGSADETMRLWDLETGEERRRFVGQHGRIMCARFAPDGSFAVAGSMDDNLIAVWDLQNDKMIRWLHAQHAVSCVAISPDGKLVASGSADYTYNGAYDRSSPDHSVHVWDIGSGKELVRFDGHELFVTGVEFSPDGRTVASSSGDGTLRLWALPDSPRLQELREEIESTPAGLDALSGLREWTDNTGKYKMMAELVELLEDEVRLKKEDGSTITIPLTRLSEADRELLRNIAAGRTEVPK